MFAYFFLFVFIFFYFLRWFLFFQCFQRFSNFWGKIISNHYKPSQNIQENTGIFWNDLECFSSIPQNVPMKAPIPIKETFFCWDYLHKPILIMSNLPNDQSITMTESLDGEKQNPPMIHSSQ